MSIADLVKYDSTHEYELTHPVTGEGINVFFELRSAQSDEAKKVQRAHLDANLSAQRANRKPNIQSVERQVLDQVAALVAGWEWNGQEYQKGEGVLEYTPENVRKVLQTDWIFEQVKKASEDISNFT